MIEKNCNPNWDYSFIFKNPFLDCIQMKSLQSFFEK